MLQLQFLSKARCRRAAIVISLCAASMMTGLPAEVTAGTARCHNTWRAPNGRLVIEGDGPSRILDRMGSPAEVSTIYEPAFAHHGPCWVGVEHEQLHQRRPVRIDNWLYYFPDRRESAVRITLRNGSVKQICRYSD